MESRRREEAKLSDPPISPAGAQGNDCLARPLAQAAAAAIKKDRHS